ncbi:histidine kinase dimerization/phosphoacceptor domain -containing protein, partial [Polaribacter sp.]|uniref:histidine kinase dimerization/phosphoacceptor domain -containing protein n=1 Tax=Polaribacter sp. TaxID=1920175 RepID=UPI0035C84CE3
MKNIIKYKYSRILIVVFITLLFPYCIYSQDSEAISFESYFKSAKDLNKKSQFSKSIIDLNRAIEIAKRNNWEKEYLEANVFLGEMMRRTQDHKKGVELLRGLQSIENYPKLNANKMSRLAAIYLEWEVLYQVSRKDSSVYYVKKGLEIAKSNNLNEEEASLLNLYGYDKLVNGKKDEALVIFERSAQLFKKLNDLNNYAIVKCHIMDIYISKKNFIEADKIKDELLNIVLPTNWYGTQRTLFKRISDRFLISGDSTNYYKWLVREKHAVLEYQEAKYDRDMSIYRVEYETDKFKDKALFAEEDSKSKSISLKWQKRLNLVLIVFILIFIIASFLIYKLYVKKNKISKSLELSNRRFELLMIESNHRIKNNLQMILSMVDYSGEKTNKKEDKTLNKISSKIQTVGVLHKHLYTDVHNQFVKLETYFNEIIHLYTKMNPNNLIVK